LPGGKIPDGKRCRLCVLLGLREWRKGIFMDEKNQRAFFSRLRMPEMMEKFRDTRLQLKYILRFATYEPLLNNFARPLCHNLLFIAMGCLIINIVLNISWVRGSFFR
jgi:hypothetical protein